MPVWLKQIIGDAHATLLKTSADSRARVFLQGRGVSETEIVTHNIGLADPSLILPECTQDFLKWHQQFYRDSIVFPMYSMMGEDIGMQIRSLDPNEHTRPYKQYYSYHRDIFPYFYGLPQAIDHVYKSGYLIVVEGVFDYFAVRHVTPNVMAVLTAGVPVACKRFFNRFCTRIVAMLDMDNPGREGANRLARDAEGQNYSVTIPTYTEKDPGELYRKGKLKEIERIVRQTSNLILL